ncbi:MAG: YkvA family protein [Clostridium paraputrificum]
MEFLKEKAIDLKSNIKALYLVCRKKKVPIIAKVMAIMDMHCPIDFIPDFIPILGYLDDFILLPLGIYLCLKLIPKDLFEECKKESENLFKEGKPKNYVAGGIIVFIWIMIIIVMAKHYF